MTPGGQIGFILEQLFFLHQTLKFLLRAFSTLLPSSLSKSFYRRK